METFLFILIVLLFIYIIFSVAYSIAGIVIDYTDDFDDETMKPSRILPKDLYERTDMNIVGCTFISIFLFILSFLLG